jgi:pimeloyl-ACP methyl ester carboxylesterase
MSARRRAGIIGTAVGVAAAGAAVGIAVERYTIGRTVRQLALDRDPGPSDGSGPLGSLRGEPRKVVTDDGAELYVEVDEPAERRPGSPTIVFCHGFSLNQDSWHAQRAVFRADHRCVFWDQRGHGRSRLGAMDGDVIDRLGRDLFTVLTEVCPDDDVVLFGHSMGGMTVLALADQHPELFGVDVVGWPRVIGVALVSTSAGRISDVTFGLPRVGAWLMHRTAPGMLGLLGKQQKLVDRGRRMGTDIAYEFTKRYSFGSEVSPRIVKFTNDMIEDTRIDVIASFFPAFDRYDKVSALSVLKRVPTTVIVGDRDQLTPPPHGRVIAEGTGADLLVVPDAGHVVILEHPDVVSDALQALVSRVEGSS